MANKQGRPLGSLRDFPAVEVLAGHADLAAFIDELTRPVVVDAVREVTAESKERFQAGDTSMTHEDLLAAIAARLTRLQNLILTPVINATGIIVHTNLGRAPISEEMMRKATAVAAGYSNLEFDIGRGERGKRGEIIEHLLATLCLTEAGTIVNNNAAAVFLILNTLANRREVIISRGELVQIGGGFRIPDIMARSGVRLVEVGTTNRTTVDDYRQAITGKTAMILKVHRSNFTQSGFVEETSLKELAGLCGDRDVVLVHDIGSGLFGFPEGVTITGEPTIPESIRGGADLTCFSGDKLLGGVQAGLIAGKKELIARIRKNPLYRAFRCDKLVFAITTQVLASYLHGRQYMEIPIWRMITLPVTALKLRGEKIIAACPGKDIVLAATEAYVGGGTTPGQTIPSLAVSLRGRVKANTLADKFRAWRPPIIGRVENDDFLLDLRAIPADRDDLLAQAINSLVT
jgi:L-seryl-tRNA(Ser) seleniumtransferase